VSCARIMVICSVVSLQKSRSLVLVCELVVYDRVPALHPQEGETDLTRSDEVAQVLTGPRIKTFFRKLFGGESLTFDYKWLRAMYNGGFTGAHYDTVYMSRGTPKLLTMWTPFGDVGTRMGTIAVMPRSNWHPAFHHLRETYGAMDAEAERLQGTGWFTTDPEECIQRSPTPNTLVRLTLYFVWGPLSLSP
jgi:hypothetical protein